jgi:hypothetical protein
VMLVCSSCRRTRTRWRVGQNIDSCAGSGRGRRRRGNTAPEADRWCAGAGAAGSTTPARAAIIARTAVRPSARTASVSAPGAPKRVRQDAEPGVGAPITESVSRSSRTSRRSCSTRTASSTAALDTPGVESRCWSTGVAMTVTVRRPSANTEEGSDGTGVSGRSRRFRVSCTTVPQTWRPTGNPNRLVRTAVRQQDCAHGTADKLVRQGWTGKGAIRMGVIVPAGSDTAGN